MLKRQKDPKSIAVIDCITALNFSLFCTLWGVSINFINSPPCDFNLRSYLSLNDLALPTLSSPPCLLEPTAKETITTPQEEQTPTVAAPITVSTVVQSATIVSSAWLPMLLFSHLIVLMPSYRLEQQRILLLFQWQWLHLLQQWQRRLHLHPSIQVKCASIDFIIKKRGEQTLQKQYERRHVHALWPPN